MLPSKMVDNALRELTMINMARHPMVNATRNAKMMQEKCVELDGETVSLTCLKLYHSAYFTPKIPPKAMVTLIGIAMMSLVNPK
jgi:hypothetical protein